MSEVALQIGGRTYRVACAAGEEERVKRLGATIADKLSAMGNPTGPDAQNLLFAALLLADEVQEARDSVSASLDPIAVAKRDEETDTGEIDQLKGTIADLESELARLQTAAQHDARGMEVLLARQAEMANTITAHEADAAQLRAEIADLKAAPPTAADTPAATADLSALAPSLEHFAEMLEECADKLEARARAS